MVRCATYNPAHDQLLPTSSLNLGAELTPKHSLRPGKECVGCGTSMNWIGEWGCKRAVLDCGHKFHSEDCFLEYLVKSDPRKRDFKCPNCSQAISDSFIDSYFGRGRFKEKIRPRLVCNLCNSTNGLIKFPDCAHFLCADHYNQKKSSGSVKCRCSNDPWARKSTKKPT